MKKISVLLIAAASVFMFAGCGEKDKKVKMPDAETVISSMKFTEDGRYEKKFKETVNQEYKDFQEKQTELKNTYENNKKSAVSDEESETLKQEYHWDLIINEGKYLSAIKEAKSDYKDYKDREAALNSFDDVLDGLKETYKATAGIVDSAANMIKSIDTKELSSAVDSASKALQSVADSSKLNDAIKSYENSLKSLESEENLENAAKVTGDALKAASTAASGAVDVLKSVDYGKALDSVSGLLKALGD